MCISSRDSCVGRLHLDGLNWTLRTISAQTTFRFHLSRMIVCSLYHTCDASVEALLNLLVLLIRETRLIYKLWLLLHAIIWLTMCVQTWRALLLIVLPCKGRVFLRWHSLYVIVILLLSVVSYHFLWLDLLSPDLWQYLLLIVLIKNQLVFLLSSNSVEAVGASHWYRFYCFLATRAWATVALGGLVHLSEALAVHLGLELLRNTDTLLRRMDWRGPMHFFVHSDAIVSSLIFVSNLGCNTALVESTRGQTTLSILQTVNHDSFTTV